MSLAKEAMAIPETDAANVFLTLFSGLETVLQLRSRRGQKAFHSTVRTDVEALTGRDLDDYRLGCVLGLAGPNVVDVEWVTVGQDMNLELFQRDKNGNKRFPTLEEISQRKEDFKAALTVARESGQFPQAILPKRPAPAPTVNIRQMPVLPVPQEQPIGASPTFDKSSTRQEALLERVRARQRKLVELREREEEYERIHRGIGVCDDAEIAHKVIQSLFARGEGRNSAATEEEILQALTSASFGMQCRKVLDPRAAQEALTLVIENSLQWFTVQAGVHNPKAKYFRRSPQGRAADALAAIQAERGNREMQLRELCEKAKRQEQGEAASEVTVGREACATNAQLTRQKPREVRETAKQQKQGEALSNVTNTRLKRPLNSESATTKGQKKATQTNERDVKGQKIATQANERDVKGDVGKKGGESLLKRPRLRKKTSEPTTDRVLLRTP
jgi:hypothetical protein